MKKKLLFIIPILLITTLAVSASFLPLRKFGGLNTRSNPYELQDYEASDMSNFTLDKAGSITERNLFKRYNTTSIGNISFTNLYKFYSSSDTSFMVLSGGNKLYKATSGLISDISNATSVITPNSQWAFETFSDGTNELVFAANNDDVLQSYGGSGNFADESGYPGTNCNILKKHKARLWATGSKSFPYRIYYSSLSDGDDWTTSGGSFDLPDYEKIMALETLGDILYIFTRTSIYAIVGDTPNEFYILKTASRVGTHAFKSVTLGGRLIFFLNKSGVYAFDGTESVNISETIQPTIDNISSTYIGDSAGLYDKRGRYWLSYTSENGSFNDSILIYDTVVKQWYKYDNVNFSCFFKAEGGIDKGEIYVGCSNPVGYLWQLQSSSASESVTHSTYDQLSSGTTFNTVINTVPTVELLNGNDQYCRLLSHFNGPDAQASYTAETGQAFTFNGTSQLDTAQKVFGLSSFYTSSTATLPASTNWVFAGDFTIDFRVRFNALVAGRYYFILGQPNDGAVPAGWEVYYAHSGNLYFVAGSGGGAWDITQVSAPVAFTTGQWYHIAVVRKSGVITVYVDGVSKGTQATTATIPGNNTLYLGSQAYGGPGNPFDGWIDELRISGIARWDSAFSSVLYEYSIPVFSGSLTSVPLQINASGQSSLGKIDWSEDVPTNTDIQFTTRTGTTSDTVYFNGWEAWVSSSTVVEAVTNATVWTSSDATNFVPGTVGSAQARNVLFYETDDSVSPNTVQFRTFGAVSTNDYATCTIPIKDLTNYKFIGFWLKSPTTGNSVELEISDVTGNSIGYVSANTVQADTWEKHYWSINQYTDRDEVGRLKLSYKGNTVGYVYLGEVDAYDFLDSGETITSTPNNFIQYKAILGSNIYSSGPKLIKTNNVVSISYTSSSGSSESSMTSFWQSKRFDFGQPTYNKKIDWVEITGLCNNPTTHNSVTLDYELDGGEKTGSVTGYFDVTGSTTKVKFYLPQGTYGRDFMFKIEDTDIDNDLRIDNATISYFVEA